jgi:hypothetical protein
MWNVNYCLMNRISWITAWSALTVVLLSAPAQAEPAGEHAVQPAHSESEPSKVSLFGDILQIGGRQSGKSSAGAEPKPLPDLEAKGSSDSSSKKTALGLIPHEKLPPDHRQKVATLLKSVSYYRRLPTVSFPVDPDAYQYFLAHPDVAVSVWRAMKISKLQMWQTSKTEFEADTGDGSVGALEILYCDSEKCLVTCDGLYKSTLFSKPIAAKSLLLLQTSFAKHDDGEIHVTHRADLFVNFPSQTVDVVARIFSPLTVKMTDRTFTEVSLFLKMMSTAMTRRPDWVEQITEKMDGVPELRKDQLNALSLKMYQAARSRDGGSSDDDETMATETEENFSRRRRADSASDRLKSGGESGGSTRTAGNERSGR